MTGIIDAENWVSEMPVHVREAINARITSIELAANQTFMSAGDVPEAVYQVEYGFLKLLGLYPDGRVHLIVIYSAGNTFAETTAVVRRKFHYHSTVAMVPSRVRCLAIPDFWELYRAHPEIPEALCRKFAHNLTRGFHTRTIQTTHRLRDQILSMLMNLAEFCGEAEPEGRMSFSLPITHTDIAEHLDATRQAVQREVSSLRKSGLVDRQGGKWLISNPSGMNESRLSRT